MQNKSEFNCKDCGKHVVVYNFIPKEAVCSACQDWRIVKKESVG